MTEPEQGCYWVGEGKFGEESPMGTTKGVKVSSRSPSAMRADWLASGRVKVPCIVMLHLSSHHKQSPL